MKILAISVEIGAVKAAVLDVEKAQPLGCLAWIPCVPDRPCPEGEEIGPDHLWEAVTAAARTASRLQEGIKGIGIASFSPGLVLLGSDDEPLGPIRTPNDRRARTAARQVNAAVGPEFLRATANRPLPGSISAVCYRQQVTEDPYLQRRVRRYLHVNGWLALRLTGETAFDPGNASLSGLFGTATDQRWSRRWCDFFDVDSDWLPSVRSGNETVGTLRSAVAAELGVPAGLPVKVGTTDLASVVLAAGMGPYDLLHQIGPPQILAARADHTEPDAGRRTQRLGVGEAFLRITYNPVGGNALEWVRTLCFRDQPVEEFYAQTVPKALDHATLVSLDPPFLGGNPLEIETYRAAFRDLTLATERMDFLAAVVSAFRRHHQRALQTLGKGENFSRIFLSGNDTAIVRQLLPGYGNGNVEPLEEGALRGVARLWN
jgi:xylulokinase